MVKKDLLLEIGTEELPAQAVSGAIGQLQENSKRILSRNNLSYSTVKAFGSPRRLAVIVQGIVGRQDEVVSEIKGPAKKIAYTDNGEPTLAAVGFAKSQGVDVKKLLVKDTSQGNYVFAVKKKKGEATSELLPKLLPEVILSLSFPKSMRWNNDGIRFGRPIRWLVGLYGASVVKFNLAGLVSSNLTRGHPYLVNKALPVKNTSSYEETLKKGKVIVNQDARSNQVRKGINRVAAGVGGRAVIDPYNFSEVINLVEYPHVIYGTFAKEYLKLPREVLITVMQYHQRYFPVKSKSGRLLPGFIVVHNGEPKYNKTIGKGHERVLRARLADAQFFYEEDKKSTLKSKVAKLKGVTFQEKLGTLHHKQQRIQKLAQIIGRQLGVTKDVLKHVKRAAYLCKADLVTEMVTEFPTLQGVMGKEYASLDGEASSVSQAIYEHYLPRAVQDRLPRTPEGKILALADKIDSVVGCFITGFIPTGSEDPYSLRRQAQGVIRIVLDNNFKLSLTHLIKSSLDLYKQQGVSIAARQDLQRELLEFFRKRLRIQLLNEGFGYDVLDAVLAIEFDDMGEAKKRVEAISKYLARKRKINDLLTAFTRCNNLSDLKLGTKVEKTLFRDRWEKQLYTQLTQSEVKLAKNVKKSDYSEALDTLAQFRSTVDTFFDEVLVMDENKKVRTNRVALLNRCVRLFLRVADFSRLVVPQDED